MTRAEKSKYRVKDLQKLTRNPKVMAHTCVREVRDLAKIEVRYFDMGNNHLQTQSFPPLAF